MKNRRFTVMGFTEAELGFILAAVFIAMSLVGVAKNNDLNAIQARSSASVAKAETLSHRFDSVNAAFAAYRDSVRKKSNKTPRCVEKGEPPGAIAELLILGADDFEMGGERLAFSELRARLAPQLARSAELGCRYLVRTIAVKGVDAPEHSAAVDKLAAYFDITSRKP